MEMFTILSSKENLRFDNVTRKQYYHLLLLRFTPYNHRVIETVVRVAVETPSLWACVPTVISRSAKLYACLFS